MEDPGADPGDEVSASAVGVSHLSRLDCVSASIGANESILD